jgi:mRNA interferase HigB
MILIGKKLLTDFMKEHATSRSAIEAWSTEIEAATWRCPADVKLRYRTASFIGDHVVFNLKGNHFRLDTMINYLSQVVLARRIGTHTEYDSWTF